MEVACGVPEDVPGPVSDALEEVAAADEVEVIVTLASEVDVSLADDSVAEDDASPVSVSDGDDPVLVALSPSEVLLSPAAPPRLLLGLLRVAVLVMRRPVLVWTPNIPLVTLKGAATTKVVPALANVDVTVSLPLVEVGESDIEPMSCAFAIAAGDIGTPTSLHPTCSGSKRLFVSSELSQLDLMQVMTSVRKFPFDRRHIQGMSMPLQVKSPEFSIQS